MPHQPPPPNESRQDSPITRMSLPAPVEDPPLADEGGAERKRGGGVLMSLPAPSRGGAERSEAEGSSLSNLTQNTPILQPHPSDPGLRRAHLPAGARGGINPPPCPSPRRSKIRLWRTREVPSASEAEGS